MKTCKQFFFDFTPLRSMVRAYDILSFGYFELCACTHLPPLYILAHFANIFVQLYFNDMAMAQSVLELKNSI